MTKKFRLITGLLAAVLAAVMLSSAVYIAVEANHNCSGEDCAICHQLQVCENLLKSISRIVPIICPIVRKMILALGRTAPACLNCPWRYSPKERN